MISRVTGSPFATLVSLLTFGLALELLQSTRPERLQMPDHLIDGFLVRLVNARSSLPTFLEQPRLPENRQVLGDSRSSRVEMSGDVTGSQPAQGDEFDDAATGGVRQCTKC
jgi:hypothetical protein